MAKQPMNRLKLGVFVLAGMVILIASLYLIGKNQHLFGSNYILRARFDNVTGLVAGNNVRYSGIVAGTVKSINIIADTVLEVEMTIATNFQQVIRKNAVVSIGSDGLMGNKVINIVPGRDGAAYAIDGDLLNTHTGPDTDEMLEVLSRTNRNIAEITDALKVSVNRLNSSTGLWGVLEEENLPERLEKSLLNLQHATAYASSMMANLDGIIRDVKNGKGSAGELLIDTSIAYSVKQAIAKFSTVANSADSLARQLEAITGSINNDINYGKGPANAILKDTALVNALQRSLDNIEKGTASFNENMEAMKHNWLFRGYFKKLENEKAYEEMQKEQQKK